MTTIETQPPPETPVATPGDGSNNSRLIVVQIGIPPSAAEVAFPSSNLIGARLLAATIRAALCMEENAVHVHGNLNHCLIMVYCGIEPRAESTAIIKRTLGSVPLILECAVISHGDKSTGQIGEVWRGQAVFGIPPVTWQSLFDHMKSIESELRCGATAILEYLRRLEAIHKALCPEKTPPQLPPDNGPIMES